MECKNPHCKFRRFTAVLEDDQLIGVKCDACGARYADYEIEIKKEVNRDGYWNSVVWVPEKKPDSSLN